MSMTDSELIALVESMRGSALGHNDDLSSQRQDALDRYFGRLYGNEIDGRSKVMDRSVLETIEWAKPQILRALSTSDTIAEFQPVGPDDVEQAEQETLYVNHVIMEKNDGFVVLHDAIVDILLLKNGYVKRYWEEYSAPHIENYTGLSEIALTQLMTELEEAHDTVSVLGKTERDETLDDGVNPPQPTKVYDIKLRVTDTRGRACVKASPSEEVLVSPRCRGDLQETDFVGHIPPMTRSDLLEMGMNKKFVEALPSKGALRNKPEDVARDTLDINAAGLYDPNNKPQDEIDYLEAYCRVDYDGDGIAELRKVVLCNGQLPPGPEWNEEVDEVPFSYGVATRMPHRHVGMSLADFVADLQLIRTILLRNVLDNTYIHNNQRPLVSNKVELGDLALSAPGSPIRIDTDSPDVEGHIQFAQAPQLQAMPILEYMDELKEQRTGIGKNTTIIDSDVLRDSSNDTVTTAYNAANQRVEMYLRMIAETLVKDLVRGVHGIVTRHQQEPETVQLQGKWVNVDPRSWIERTHVTVTVGLGFGTAEEKRKNLSFIGSVQQQAFGMGLVSPKNGYNLASDMAKWSGFKAKDRYFTDPASPEGQQMAQAKQQQAQAQQQMPLQIAQIKAQATAQQQQQKAQFDQQQSALDHRLSTQQINAQQHAESMKLLMEQRAEAEKMQLDHGNSQDEILLNALVKLVSAALMGKAQPQQITGDVDAARGALNGA